MPSAGDEYLIERVRLGDQAAWEQLVRRYEGRLLRFARARLPQPADAEDLVQEAFVSFLRSLGQFRFDCSLETYLFTILRRKIIDTYRREAKAPVCRLQDAGDREQTPGPNSSDPWAQVAATGPSVSWYARRDEQAERLRTALGRALTALIDGYKRSGDLTALQIVELLFYCQRANQAAAALLGISANRVGVTKHRALKELRSSLAGVGTGGDLEPAAFEGLLSELWQTLRPSCPKRSTVGALVLGTLDEPWRSYVDFHVNTLGCHFCRANLADLEDANRDDTPARRLQERILQSTVGFLHQP